MDYKEKEHLCNMVKAACSTQDIKLLKELLPTPEKLVEYQDVQNGGGLLHTLMHAYGDNPVEFLDSIIAEYNLDANPEIKKELFLKRDANGKYAADFNYIYDYLHPQVRNAFDSFCGKSEPKELSDTRTDAEKNKVKLYSKIKKQIKLLSKDNPKEIAFGIPKAFNDTSDNHFDAVSSGTPASNALYLPDKDGKPALYIRGSIQEEYPEIRLLNYADKESNIEDGVCVIRGVKLNSKESYLEQAIKKMDFPEDFAAHFHALQVFEEDYKRLSENEAKNAMNRHLNKRRGAIVFETAQQKDVDGNNNSSGYGGYIVQLKTPEEGKTVEYPIIVLPSMGYGVQEKYDKSEKHKDTFVNIQRKLYHEMFHGIDKFDGVAFSEMPIFKYAMMLEESKSDGKFAYMFDIANGYKKGEYNGEMAAYIMGMVDKEALKDSPLLAKVYELGECYAIAKANNDKGAISRIETAMDRSPHNTTLRIKHHHFMRGKESGSKFEMDENQRQSFESHIIKQIDKTIEIIKSNQQSKTINKGYER